MSFIPLMSPSIPEGAIEAVVEVLRSGMLVQGKNVAEFEKEVGRFLQADHVVAVSNGTASLHLALMALGVGPGDEVIVPAFSYPATANVVEVVGATCVFVDVESETFNIDVSKVESAITTRTRAMIPVHEFGLACDVEKLTEIAGKQNAFIIEDAACALGATDAGRFAGTVGEFGSFSLHPRKAVTSGEGGLIVTSDESLARSVRALRNHGIDPEREGMKFVGAGLNYRMTDFQAALVRPQFAEIASNIVRKTELANVYFDLLQSEQLIRLPIVPEDKKHTWQTFHVVLDRSIDRDSVIASMKDAGVGTNLGAQCIPAQEYYSKKYTLDSAQRFPNALDAFEHGLALPLYEKLTEDDVVYVAQSLQRCLRIR